MIQPNQTARRNEIPIQCPQCGNAYSSPVISMIDVGAMPELRTLFLSGQLNMAVCPKCQTPIMLEVPLVYHDSKAEFLAIYFPQQLNIPELEKQKMIGELTQALMRSLPPDQRKGYFLNPRQFVSRQNLTDAVYGTMGISQEELDRGRKKAKFAEQLMVFADDPKGLQMMIKGNDAQLDGEFFAVLGSLLEQARAAGDEKSTSRLELLRENLLPVTTWGKRAQKQAAAVESLKDVKSPAELLDRIVGADDDELSAIVLAARPAFDYSFFEALTGRVDAASAAEKERLSKLRGRLLDLTQQLDQAARAEIDERISLLQEIINAPSPRSAVLEHADDIDEMFMSILARNIEAAEKKGDRALMERLAMVYQEIVNLMRAGAPPEAQLLDELIEAPYPEGTRQLLQDNREHVTPELLDLIAHMADEMAKDAAEDAADMAKRLRDIRAQAMLMV